jgi:hypothetical protein
MTDMEDVGAEQGRVADEALAASLNDVRAELDELRTEVARLDADLGESRRLNLRAAELLDLVYERLGAPAAASTGVDRTPAAEREVPT